MMVLLGAEVARGVDCSVTVQGVNWTYYFATGHRDKVFVFTPTNEFSLTPLRVLSHTLIIDAVGASSVQQRSIVDLMKEKKK
jgi:hypothetical protein